MRRRQQEEAKAENSEEEEEGGGIEATLNNFTIETVGTEEEASEGLEAAFGMKVNEDGGSKG